MPTVPLSGRFRMKNLRTAIVIAYLRAKGLIDSHLLNNGLIDEHKRLKHAVSGGTDEIEAKILENACEELKDYRQGIQSAYNDAKTAVIHALKLTERFWDGKSETATARAK